MDEHPHLFYESFLINESIQDYQLPSVYDSVCNDENWELLPMLEGHDAFINSDLPELDVFITNHQNAGQSNANNLEKSSTSIENNNEHDKCKEMDSNATLNKLIVNENDEFLSENFQKFNSNKNNQEIINCKIKDQKHSFTEYIFNTIQNGLNFNKVRPGRPKQKFNTSSETISAFLDKYVNTLQNLIESNFTQKRSDTFRFTIFSYLKKLPIKLREISCSASDPKSNRLEIFLDAFLSPFVTCKLNIKQNC